MRRAVSKRPLGAVFRYPTERDAFRQVPEIQPFVFFQTGTGGRTCNRPISQHRSIMGEAWRALGSQLVRRLTN